MKICPKCNKTYSDETLNFCLDDGTVLTHNTATNIETPETVFVQAPQETQNNNAFGTQPTVDNQQRYQASSRSGSKTWIWVLGILFGVVVLCSGGFIGLVAIGSMVDDEKPPTEYKEKADSTEVNTDSDSSDGLVKSTDFRDMKFGSNSFITADNDNGRLELTSRKNYYYVFALNKYPTQDRKVKLTVKNIKGRSSTLGFGLVVQSHPEDVLVKDYAFVIRSNRRQFRIVKHRNKKESVLVNWKRSSAIKKGTALNDLEVEINDNKMKFYINGEFIRTVTDKTGYKDGVAGVYTSDDIPIAFTKLELRK